MKVLIKNARLSFNDLFKAKVVNDGDPAFSATVICSPETKIRFKGDDGEPVLADHSKLEEVCAKVLKDKFGKVPAKINNWVYNKADGSTTRDKYVNEDGEFWDGFTEETWFITAKKKEELCKGGKIDVLDQRKDPIEANSGILFSGCYVNLVIDVYAYDRKDGKGVSASLEGIQLLRSGEPLGFAPVNAADEFDEEDIDASEDDAADLM